MKVYINGRGDPTTGINALSATVDFEEFEYQDRDHLESIRKQLAETFGLIFDDKVTVRFEDELADDGTYENSDESGGWGTVPCGPTAEQQAYYEECRLRGYTRGRNMASGQDIPVIGECVTSYADGSAYDLRDREAVEEFVIDSANASEECDRSFTPFEFTAHEFNSRDDADECWAAFDDGIAQGIADEVKARCDVKFGAALPKREVIVRAVVMNPDLQECVVCVAKHSVLDVRKSITGQRIETMYEEYEVFIDGGFMSNGMESYQTRELAAALSQVSYEMRVIVTGEE